MSSFGKILLSGLCKFTTIVANTKQSSKPTKLTGCITGPQNLLTTLSLEKCQNCTIGANNIHFLPLVQQDTVLSSCCHLYQKTLHCFVRLSSKTAHQSLYLPSGETLDSLWSYSVPIDIG